MTSTAQPLAGVDAIAQGAGELNIKAAVAAATPARATQTFAKALGTGSLEGARGNAHVAHSETGVELTGEQDIMGQPWNPAAWTVASATGNRDHFAAERFARARRVRTGTRSAALIRPG